MQELAKDEIMFKMAIQNPKLAITIIVVSVVVGIVLGVVANIRK